MDNCCFNRIFDDRKNVKNYLERETILIIFELIRNGGFELVGSETLRIEISAIRDDVSGEATTLEDIKKAVDTSRTDRDLKLNIVLRNADGTTLDWTKGDDIWTYKFTTAGNYTISYIAEDKAGNENSDVLYSFEVKSTSSTSSISEATWGAVLIVISVALLAGVVIFFVKTKDSSTPKDSKKEDKE